MRFRPGLRPGPRWELTALPRLLAGFRGPYFSGERMRRRGTEGDEKGKLSKGESRERGKDRGKGGNELVPVVETH